MARGGNMEGEKGDSAGEMGRDTSMLKAEWYEDEVA